MSFLDKVKEASDKAGKAVAKAQEEARQKAIDLKNDRGDKIHSLALEYMGGYGDYKKANGILSFYQNQTEFSSPLSTKFIIKNDLIADVAIEGKDEVNRRVTVTRLLLVGIFAFALKKKNKDKDAFLTLVLSDGQEAIFHIEKKTPMEMKAKLSKAIALVKQNSMVKSASAAGQASGGSRADELAKLAELKNSGVLSDEEFEREKQRVLGL